MSGIFYGFLQILIYGLGRLFFRFQTTGRNYVPRRGGLLIAANHTSYLDIPFLGCALPRQVAFLGRQDLFPSPVINGLLRWLGWIPIRHDRLDRAGIAKAMDLIKSGNAVVIYPEGTRSRDGRLQPGKPGIGVIVAKTGCPVVPVYIGGTHAALPVGASWPRLHPVHVVIGKPVGFSAESHQYSRKEFYQYVSRAVMGCIAELGHVPQPTYPSVRSQRAESPGRHPAAGPYNAE